MFRVSKAFYLAQRDLIVLTGTLIEGEPAPGMLLDLPRTLGGPGPVPIHSVEAVQFAGGREQPALTVAYGALSSVPMFEPSAMEGRTLMFVPGGPEA